MPQPIPPMDRIKGSLLVVAATLLALSILVLAIWWPSLMTLVHNNLGSTALNRALLGPGLTEEERLALAMDAGRSFQTALAWDPHNGQAYYNLATIYDFWGDSSSAGPALERAAALLPRDPVTQLRHGLVLADQGQESRAIDAWQAAGAATYFLARGQDLTGQGDHEAALEAYQRAVLIDPHNAEAYLRLAQVLNRLGRDGEALEALASAAEVDRGSSERPYLLQAEIYVARGEWAAALGVYRAAADRAPWDPEVHYRRGLILSEMVGDAEAAVASFEQALEVDPQHRPSFLALGRLYAAEGACDTAERWLDPLLSPTAEDGSAPRLHLLLAECLLGQGRPSRALSHLELARSLEPEVPSTLLRVARGYSQAGRFEDAAAIYSHILELAPKAVEAEEAREAVEQLRWSDTTGGD